MSEKERGGEGEREREKIKKYWQHVILLLSHLLLFSRLLLDDITTRFIFITHSFADILSQISTD